PTHSPGPTASPGSAQPDLAELRAFAEGCDVLTVDPDHVSGPLIDALTAEGVAVYPGATALRYAHDRHAARAAVAGLGLAVPPPGAVQTPAGLRVRRELAAMVARSPWGQAAAYPIVETRPNPSGWAEVLAPAPGLDPEATLAMQHAAIRIADALDVVGVLAVLLAEPDGSPFVVNDVVMRPHWCAYWTMAGARTSQFEQHLRAVLDYPLGETTMATPAVVTAIVRSGQPGGMGIDERLHHLFAAEPGARVHLYGTAPTPDTEIGHITVLGDDLAELRDRAARAARWLREGTGEA
ncbi:MAG: ATP-grasp domain-containing protein, partial [Sporichthyaceae bacterium]|nr:ATP-grasp domain-containing protein [Sporichthyaceae bacterium]